MWLDGAWLSPGEIAWGSDGRVTALRRPRGPVADLAVFPSLVNAHVHLQLPALPRAPRRFDAWLRAVMAAQGRLDPRQLLAIAAAHLDELRASGTGAVGEIDSSGLAGAALARARMRGRVYRELTGFHLDRSAAAALVRARRAAGTRDCPAGLSPHAPYSVSSALFRAAVAARVALSVHVAETEDEQRFLRTGRGPFADLLAELGRLPPSYRPPGTGAVRHLERLGVLRPTTLLVHCQELERGDVARIAAAGAAIAVCPGTIEWFSRAAPPVPRWLAAGIPVALGTDSRASNRGMSMVAELRRAARLWPQLAPDALLELATGNGARALGRPGLGRLRRGGRADFFAIRAAATGAASLQRLLHGPAAILGVWSEGRPLRVAPAGARRGAATGDGAFLQD